LKIRTPSFTSYKFIFFLVLAIYSSAGLAQEKDTVLFIPKTKYQTQRIVTKTDSIMLLKRKAILTAKTAKELTDRMAELDSILLSYKNFANIVNSNTPKKNTNRQRINVDSLNTAKKAKENRNAVKLARLNAIIRKSDSVKAVKARRVAARNLKRKQDSTRLAQNNIKKRLRNDSIRTAKALIAAKNRRDSIRIAQKLQKEKFRQDSIKTVIAFQQKAKFKADSIKVVQAKIVAEQLLKIKQDSVRTAIALQQKMQLRADSIKVVQAKIVADQIAKRKQDSIATVIALQQKAQLRSDSIKVAQAKIVADQIAKRKQDSTATVIALQQKAQLRSDSIKVAQAKIVADQIAKRKQDSTVTVIALQQKAQLRSDSIRVAQAKIVADQIAKRKQDSITTVIALQQKAQLRSDSIKVAQAKIVADQIAKRRQDSITTVVALQQKAQLRSDSIKVAQAKIVADQIAKRRQDSITTVVALQQKAQLRSDSIKVAQAKIVADQIAKRKQDSITTVIALQQKAQLRSDSIRVAQAKIVADQIAKRKQDSITTVIALQQKAQLRSDSIRVAQAKIVADQIAKRKQDSTATVIALQQKAQLRSDSIRVAQAKIVADQIAKRKQDSITTVIALQQKAQLRSDSIRVAQAKIVADQIAKRKQDSITTVIALQQKAQLRSDSIKVAQAKILTEQIVKRKQDSTNRANALQQRTQFQTDSIRIAKLIHDEIIKRKQDSLINLVAEQNLDNALNTAVTNNNTVNRNKNLLLNNPDFVKATKVYDTMPYIRTGNLLTKFVKSQIDLKQGQIVSNVLKVVNIGRTPITFSADLLIPAAWTRIDDPEKKYIAKQNDTIIVPIIISPTKLVNGNTEIIINSFLIGSEQQQLANNYFSLKTKKEVSWKIELNDRQNVYLKNDEKDKRFKFRINNTGNYKQDLFINYSVPKKDLYLSDTLGNIIKKPNLTFSLEAGEKKNFDYLVTFKDMNKRNFRRISYSNYSPNKIKDKETHNLIINTSEPRLDKNSSKKRTKVSFVKLPNEVRDNLYGYPYLPITVLLNAQNILNERSFLTLSLRGFKQLNKNANIMYSTDFSYSNSYYTKNILNDAPWYIGYFDEKKTLEVGQIGNNLIGISSSGYGVKGSYKINDSNEVGAFYVNSNGFIASNSSISFGAWHNYVLNENVKLKSQFGRNINSISNRTINVLSFQPLIRVGKKHSISITSSFTNKKMDNEPTYFNPNGLLIGVSYNTKFLNKRLGANFSARYNNRDFGFGNFDRLFFNQRTTYKLSDKWNTFLSSNYQQSSNYNPFTGDVNYSQKSFFNNLIFNTRSKVGSYQPGLFYEYREFPNSIIHNRGLTFRFSSYNYEKQFLNSFYLKAGYTKPTLNNIQNRDYFNFELSSLTRFRTWNFNARYNLGAFSSLTSQQALNDFITPQSLRISAQNQYLFPNRKLIVESNAVYSFNNVFNNHTLGIYPTLYFFNKTGWRFGMSANYTFTTSDYSSVYDPIDNQSGDQFNGLSQTTNTSFNLNFSLKKDFGIPIPFVDKTAATAKFIAFLDVNGNGTLDNDETTLENVVIIVNKKEVLTNFNGEAVIKNVLKGEYDLNAFSLEDLNGWFPNTNKTIFIENDDIKYIPFVRGVKVYGDVVLDRQKIAVADDNPVDLSRIKISATIGDKIYSSLTNNSGRFEFYLPFGDYVITMDEAILNERLQITRNNIPLKLKNGQDGVYVSFYIIEKRRKVIFTDFTKKKN